VIDKRDGKYIQAVGTDLSGRDHLEHVGIDRRTMRTDLKVIGLKGVDWRIYLAQNTIQYWLLMNHFGP
jgi:hypothetical protein